MATKKKMVITILTEDHIVVDVAELSLPDSVDGLIVETKITNDDEPRLKRDRNRSPLSPEALVLADLRVGMHIKVYYTGYCSELMGHEGIITAPPKKDSDGDIIVPIAIIMPEGGVHHTTLDASMMGLIQGKDGAWDKLHYTLGIA